MSLEGAAEVGSRVDALKELRKLLARAIDECESKRDLSSLSARFMTVVEQIEAAEGSAGVASKADPVELILAEVVNLR